MPAPQFAPQYAPQYAPPQQQQPRQPARQGVVRGAMPRESPREQPKPRATASARVAIPTPEELGVSGSARSEPQASRPAPRAEEVDWGTVRRTLQQIGAVSFRLDQLSGGKSRFSVWLPGVDRPVQADAATEADAVRECLQQARSQVALKR